MLPIHILEDGDIILATDYVRQLSLTFTGQSETLATSCTYGGGRINRLGWMLAKEVCPYWVGKTVGAFNTGMNPKHRHMSEVSAYEFIRGAIPKTHLEPEG